MSAGHSETLSKHLTGVLYVGQKNILFCLFFFFLGHFREDIFLGEITYLERPYLKPTPPCSAAVSKLKKNYRRLLHPKAIAEKGADYFFFNWRLH